MLSSPMTTNFQLQKWARKLQIPLVGIFSKDELRNVNPFAGAYIINLADSDQQGTHWTAFFLSKEKGNKPVFLYFDSFGAPPPISVIKFAQRFGVQKIISSEKQCQSIRSGFCGQYSIIFLYQMSRKPKKWTYANWYKYFLDYFEDEGKRP